MNIYCEKRQLKILVVSSTSFVADTEIVFGYNFVAPLIFCLMLCVSTIDREIDR